MHLAPGFCFHQVLPYFLQEHEQEPHENHSDAAEAQFQKPALLCVRILIDVHRHILEARNVRHPFLYSNAEKNYEIPKRKKMEDGPHAEECTCWWCNWVRPPKPVFFSRQKTTPIAGLDITLIKTERNSEHINIIARDTTKAGEHMMYLNVAGYTSKGDERSRIWICKNDEVKEVLKRIIRFPSRKKGKGRKQKIIKMFKNTVVFNNVPFLRRISCIAPGVHAYKFNKTKVFVNGPNLRHFRPNAKTMKHGILGEGVLISLEEYSKSQ